MEDKSMKINILNQFFADKNVNFPRHPKLVNGIHVYEAPKGLGIQFRGGTEKILVKGADTYQIWEYLKNMLDGKHTLEEILNKGAEESKLDRVNIAYFLKTLHSYHLLEPNAFVKGNPIKVHFDLFSEKQSQYYNRVVPLSGLNKCGEDVLKRIRNCKVLLIANEILAPLVSHQMQMAGFQDMGFLVISNEDSKGAKEYISNQINIMIYEDITGRTGGELRNILSQKIPDYQYIFTVLNNPNIFFLNEISRMCTIFNIPMLSISMKDNNYEVGPFYFPEMGSPCISCYYLREQSYRLDSAYEYIYQQGLHNEGKKTDDEIMGFDYNSMAIVVNIAICQFKNAIANVAHPTLIGGVFKFNGLTYVTSLENTIKVPDCPSCNNTNKR
ncbi:MAG: hypothetical protein K2M13_03810 [Muribaculaceae bacterium]|nr:hypothetical protein [Muribaculaceae bacterium]